MAFKIGNQTVLDTNGLGGILPGTVGQVLTNTAGIGTWQDTVSTTSLGVDTIIPQNAFAACAVEISAITVSNATNHQALRDVLNTVHTDGYKLGDHNNNGVFNSADIIHFLQLAEGLTTPTSKDHAILVLMNNPTLFPKGQWTDGLNTFYTYQLEALVNLDKIEIKDTGDINLGTYDLSWGADSNSIHANQGSWYSDTTSNKSGLANNAYLATAGWKSIMNTGTMSRYEQSPTGHTFSVATPTDYDQSFTWTTAMTIANNGFIGIGETSPVDKLHIKQNGDIGACLRIDNSNTSSAGSSSVVFERNGTVVGTIQLTGSATIYGTSSDYRLKENVMPMSGATAQTKLLKPCNFDWIAGGNVNGFIAHELAEVVPDAVYGTKDAMMDEEYEVTPATDTEEAVMGTRSVPDMQGIDQSKLVPLLTATIQELIARIEALEAG